MLLPLPCVGCDSSLSSAGTPPLCHVTGFTRDPCHSGDFFAHSKECLRAFAFRFPCRPDPLVRRSYPSRSCADSLVPVFSSPPLSSDLLTSELGSPGPNTGRARVRVLPSRRPASMITKPRSGFNRKHFVRGSRNGPFAKCQPCDWSAPRSSKASPFKPWRPKNCVAVGAPVGIFIGPVLRECPARDNPRSAKFDPRGLGCPARRPAYGRVSSFLSLTVWSSEADSSSLVAGVHVGTSEPVDTLS
jgi:hypothetical protein